MSVELKKDTIISHYRILEKLGEGGMGVVYKAEDTELKRTVALKFLPQNLSLNREEKKRFEHEAIAAASLDHSNICAIHEIDETEDGQMFIAMTCYEGKTLNEKIASGPLPLDEANNIAIQVAEGLQEAHEKKIVHRDIKSANIIITDKGIVKILDFGLAKLKGLTRLTKEGTTLGTAAYMSPEQASGEKVGQRSDLWSLGVLLYEMVTGQLPFRGEYQQAIMYAIMNEEPEPVTGLRSGVPMELERIIKKALAKEPSERYQNAADILVDFRQLRKTQTEKPITRPHDKRKNRKLINAAGIFFISALVVVVSYLIFVGNPGKDNTNIKQFAVTTSSPHAYQNYVEGKKHFDFGKFTLAKEYYLKAVQYDPEFASAYRALAIFENDKLQKKKYIEKALKLVDKVTERERLQIHGSYYSLSVETYGEAIDIYKRLLQIHPDDEIGNTDIGSLYQELGKWDDAIKHFEILAKISPYPDIWISLADAYMAKGMYDKAEAILNDTLKKFPKYKYILNSLFKCYIVQNKYDLAATIVKKIETHQTKGVLRLTITYLDGAYDIAEKEVKRILKGTGRWRLWMIYMAQGKVELAKIQAQWKKRFPYCEILSYLELGKFEDSLRKIDFLADNIEKYPLFNNFWGQINLLELRGRTYIAMKSLDKAQNIANRIKEKIGDPIFENRMHRYFHLMGQIEREKTNFQKAIMYFEKALSMLPCQGGSWHGMSAFGAQGHAGYIEPLAKAYFLSGNMKEARKQYQEILSLTYGRLNYGHIYARSFYMLGKIYQNQNLPEKAIDSYSKFAKLWKNCDPQFQYLVKDARQQIKTLREKKTPDQ